MKTELMTGKHGHEIGPTVIRRVEGANAVHCDQAVPVGAVVSNDRPLCTRALTPPFAEGI